MNNTGSKIIEVARKFIGISFAHKGRIHMGKLDCLGLILAVAQELQLKSKDKITLIKDINPAYGTIPNYCLVEELLQSHLYEVPQISLGNIALIKLDDKPRHLAFIGNHSSRYYSLIHSYLKAGNVCEHILDENWHAKIHKIFRLDL